MHAEATRVPGVEVVRFGASLTFANKDVLRRAVIKLVEKSDNEQRLAERDSRPLKPRLQVHDGGRNISGWCSRVEVWVFLSSSIMFNRQ